MTGLGMILLGGEAYITFKPNLVVDQGNITDENTRKFRQDHIDRFAFLVGRLTTGAGALSGVVAASLRSEAIQSHRRLLDCLRAMRFCLMQLWQRIV